MAVRVNHPFCVRCGKPGQPDAEGRRILGLQCSHYHSRRHEGTRFEPANCDPLCPFPCHALWGGDDRASYTAYKRKELGDAKYNQLTVQAHTYHKRDRKMALLMARTWLRELLKKRVDSPHEKV